LFLAFPLTCRKNQSSSLHWKVGRVLALEDAIDIAGGTLVLVDVSEPTVEKTQ
jgi:hypothetical protein